MRRTQRTLSTLRAGVAAAVLMTVVSRTQGQCAYDLQIIGDPQCPWAFALTPLAIDDEGVIVGWGAPCGSNTQRAFRWSADDGLTFLSLGPGMSTSNAVDVLEDGTIVGWGATGLFAVRKGFVWKDGVVQVIAPSDPAIWVDVEGAMADGTVVGYLTTPSNVYAFLWKDGAFLPLPKDLALPGVAVGKPSRNGWVNAAIASVRFTSVFAWSELLTVATPLPKGHLGPEPRAANCRGETIGRVFLVPPGQPLIGYDRIYRWNGTAMEIIGPPPGFDVVSPRGMNDVGQIVGQAYCKYTPPDCAGTAVLWQNGMYIDFADFLPSTLVGGVHIATAINNRGQVVVHGWATNQGSLFLFTPNPPPGDVDIDCRVGLSDLGFVLENWGPVDINSVARADLDGSGIVDAVDLALVLGNWTP